MTSSTLIWLYVLHSRWWRLQLLKLPKTVQHKQLINSLWYDIAKPLNWISWCQLLVHDPYIAIQPVSCWMICCVLILIYALVFLFHPVIITSLFGYETHLKFHLIRYKMCSHSATLCRPRCVCAWMCAFLSQPKPIHHPRWRRLQPPPRGSIS